MAGKSHKETANDNTRAYHERMKTKKIPMEVDDKGRYLTWRWDVENGNALSADKMKMFKELCIKFGDKKYGNV